MGSLLFCCCSKDHSVNESVNDEGVCTTALATQGLLKTYMSLCFASIQLATWSLYMVLSVPVNHSSKLVGPQINVITQYRPILISHSSCLYQYHAAKGYREKAVL